MTSMVDIFIGQVIETIDPDLKTTISRVIWVHPQRETIGLFDIRAAQAMPEQVPYQTVAAQLLDSSARQLEIDPYRFVAFLEPGEHKSRMDRCFESIRDLVENHIEELFDPVTRGQLINAAAKNQGTSKTQILKRLRRFWARGMIPKALLPD